MADFRTSTHRAKWIFSPQELLEKYKTANERAINALQQYGATRLEVDVDGTLSYPEPILDLNNGNFSTKYQLLTLAVDYIIGDRRDFQDQCPSLPKPLSCEEEHLMRIFYEHKIQEVCAAFRFPHKIQGTAILYFKRFYLQWSVMEHHPKHIMLTCIYSSCKVEENHVSAEELGKGIQQDHQVILNNEMIVLQSLGFDLIVYTPYRSIEGFVDDMEEFFRSGRSHQQKFQELRETAKFEVDRSMLTDAPLLFPPGQLALSALRRSNEVHKVVDFQRYLDGVLSRQHSSHTISELFESFRAIDLMVSELKVPSMRELRHIDRKLTACWDPSSQDESKKRDKKSKHKSKKPSSEAHERLPTM